MSDRRFTDKPDLDPTMVRALPPEHPALVESRTLFPSTVVTVTKDVPDRLLVSGVNNRKLGATVTKGHFKGYALYGLSLEERATCPADCDVREICYGNGMQLARRHRIGDADAFFDRLGFEIGELLDEHDGLLVRLHVLGDFPSLEYVSFWADALEENERLACYGYTHRLTTAWGGDEIGDAIDALKTRFPDRFRIRWSSPVARPDGAVVTGKIPTAPRTSDGIVCPAQTDATACCASCGLCWEPAARHDTIVFVKHGPKSAEAGAKAEMAKSDARQFQAALVAALPKAKHYALKLCKNPTLAEDLVQEAAAKALAHSSSFEVGLNLEAWFSTILKNHFLGQMRKSGREIQDTEEGLIIAAATSNDDTEAAVEARDALEHLSEVSQAPEMLEIASGASYEEVAERVGVPVGTIKSRVSRGRDAFTALLDRAPQGVAQDLPPAPSDARVIAAIAMPGHFNPAEIKTRLPIMRLVQPSALMVEGAYQRDLSGKSMKLIRKIVAGWDWAKFKPPVCAETADGLFVIDGQHTAIAAASHPGIAEIPVMIVEAPEIERRADAFVAHNRDRLTMSAFQIFHGEVAAGVPEAVALATLIRDSGASVPRVMPQKGRARIGEIVPIVHLRRAFHASPALARRIVRIVVVARLAPVSTTAILGLRMLLTERHYEAVAALHDDAIAASLGAIPNLEATAQAYAGQAGMNRYRACATLIAQGVAGFAREAAE